MPGPPTHGPGTARKADDPQHVPEMLRIQLDEHVRPPRLQVSGQIDLATQREFHTSVTNAVSRVCGLILDLRGVTHLNSAGIGTLYLHHEKLTAVVVEPNSVIDRALHYSGFVRLVPVLHDA